MEMKKIYYAHSLAIYNTQQETRDLDLITKLFIDYTIMNPNTIEVQKAYKGKMDLFKIMIEECDLFIFRALPNGKIPAGIAKEIGYAQDIGMEILELPCLTGRTMTVDDTRQFLKEIGAR